MKDERRGSITTSQAGDMIREQTGYKPDIFEASGIAVRMNAEFEEHLRKGEIPVRATLNEEESAAEVIPLYTQEELKPLWRRYSDMGEDEMDQRIKNSGVYPIE